MALAAHAAIRFARRGRNADRSSRLPAFAVPIRQSHRKVPGRSGKERLVDNRHGRAGMTEGAGITEGYDGMVAQASRNAGFSFTLGLLAPDLAAKDLAMQGPWHEVAP